MRLLRSIRRLLPMLALPLLAGCAGTASTLPTPRQAGSTETPPSPADARTPVGSPFGERRGLIGDPLVIDREDLRLGTTVQFHRVPNASELHDLTLLPGLARVVLSFDEWPDYAAIEVLNQVPEGVQLVVVLQGWPPLRAAVDAWNYLRVPARAIAVVSGPPASIEQVTNANAMRALERVIAVMDEPSRSGFERLQRPLSFRKVVE